MLIYRCYCGAGGTPSTDVEEYWGGDIGWIGSGELKNNIIRYPTKYITTEGLQQSSTKLLPKNTTVLAMTGATLGKIGFLNFECCGNQSVAGFVNLVNLDSKFLYYYLQRITKQIESLAGGGAQAGINKSNIENINIKIPSLEEQQKIANCLSSLDELIEAQEEKLKLLKEHKKGLMQQLFPQANDNRDITRGGNLPKLRFPEFINHGAWEEKTLGEVAENYSGLTNKTKEDFGKGKPYIQYKQVFDSSKIDIQKCDLVSINKEENQNKVKYGDILFTISSETIEEIGMSSVLLADIKELYLNSFCFGVRPKSLEVLNPLFSRYLFRSNEFRKNIIKLGQGSTRYNISKGKVMELKINLPSFAEQQKIADCLSSLDETIEAQDQKIELLKQHKKGLIQGLFPVIN